ncbi:MAG: Ca2+-dependent phosphoinositide-specific phospholipase C [Asticcacaulis sp.]
MKLQSLGGLACALWAGMALAAPPSGRLNNVQFIGTHNSYHVAPDRVVLRTMLETNYAESSEWPAERLVPALDYTHDPLEVQLDMGLRVFELDVHDDPDGGRYANPGFLKTLPQSIAQGLSPVDPDGDLLKPGLKVFHAADTDVRSRCLRFMRCLEILRDWSLANPWHMPIIVQIETKESVKPPLAGAYVSKGSAPFKAEAWGRLHAEIEAVFSREQILRPSEVQGDYPSVNAAVRARGWPKVEALRGRVIFLLLDDPKKQTEYAAFTAGPVTPLLFVSRSERDPATGWLIQPKPKVAQIRSWVRQGFLVYTRADAGGEDSAQDMVKRRNDAFASGAQMISTDYPKPSPRTGPYVAKFPSGFVRCNPAQKGMCRTETLQDAPKKRE